VRSDIAAIASVDDASHNHGANLAKFVLAKTRLCAGINGLVFGCPG